VRRLPLLSPRSFLRYTYVMNTHSLFFKLFPPPKILVMRYAGLDISDDALRCIEYRHTAHGLVVETFDSQDLPAGLVDGGDIKDEKEFVRILTAFAAKNHLSRVKVSLPEEKAYLFQTDVPSVDFRSIASNIESKLDQNVPLSAPDALFQFDLMPRAVTGDLLRASVSVVPRTYVEHMMSILESAHLTPVAFEVVPKALVAAYVPPHAVGTHLIVHVMRKKTGLYIVSEGVVCFTSTIGWGSADLTAEGSRETLMGEIARVYSYWIGRNDVHGGISEVVVVGANGEECETFIRNHGGEAVSRTQLPNVWQNAFDIASYVPPITRSESFVYAVAVGLAL
jgi:hypothetical protein